MEEINGIKYIFRTEADKIILNESLDDEEKVTNLQSLEDQLLGVYTSNQYQRIPLVEEDLTFLNKELEYIKNHIQSKESVGGTDKLLEHIPYDFFEIEHTLVLAQRKKIAPLIRKIMERSN